MKKGRRYNSFSINLGDEGGEIKMICPVDKFLEVYSTKGIYQIYPPESLDPKETNPDIPVMSKKVYDIGTSNWIVARIMVQNYQIINSHGFLSKETKMIVATHLRDIMSAILTCNEICNAITKRVSEVEKQVISNGLKSKGNVLTQFPTMDGLDERVTLFLTKAKQSVQRIIDIFNIFYESPITNPRIDKLINWSEKNDIDTYVIDTLNHFKPITKYIVDLRDRQEHPKENYTLEFSDFIILPTGEISAPLWGINEAKHAIHKEMDTLIKEIVVFVELLVINLVLSKEKKNLLFELCAFQIPDKQMDLDCPIKYIVETCFKQDSKHRDERKDEKIDEKDLF